MTRLLYAVPLLAVPLLVVLYQVRPPEAKPQAAGAPKPTKARPAIDADAPAKIETATFALG
jgi:hypothetical protein